MSKAWKNTTNGMLVLVIAGFVTFAVNVVMLRSNYGGGMAVIGLVLPIFYLITLIMKKQRAFAMAIFVISIISIISGIFTLATYAGMWDYYISLFSLIPLIMVLSVVILVCNIYLLINVNKLRKEPKY